MVLYNPPGVDSLGKETVLWVPAISVLTAMTVAEATATGVLNITMAIRQYSPGGEQGTSEDVRHGSKQTFENPGKFKPTIEDITYVYDPQATTGAALNKHYENLLEGAAGFIVNIRGIDVETWVATAAQKYVVRPVVLGAQREVPIDPTAEGGKFEIIQKPYIKAPGQVRGIIAA